MVRKYLLPRQRISNPLSSPHLGLEGFYAKAQSTINPLALGDFCGAGAYDVRICELCGGAAAVQGGMEPYERAGGDDLYGVLRRLYSRLGRAGDRNRLYERKKKYTWLQAFGWRS